MVPAIAVVRVCTSLVVALAILVCGVLRWYLAETISIILVTTSWFHPQHDSSRPFVPNDEEFPLRHCHGRPSTGRLRYHC